MKLDLKEWINKVMLSCVKSTTFTATADANGYVHLPSSLDNAIPLWAETTVNTTQRPCFLRNSSADAERYGLRFKTWNDAVVFVSQSITITVWYVGGGVVRKLLKALKPLTLGRGWAV